MSNTPDGNSEEANSDQPPKLPVAPERQRPVHPLDQDYDDIASSSSRRDFSDNAQAPKKAGGLLAGFASGSRQDEDESAYFASKPTAIDTGPDRAYRPLLKPSLYFTLAAAGVMIVANVASSSAAYGSAFYNASNALFRTTGALTAVGLVLILVAFRIPTLQRSRPRFRRLQSSIPFIARILIATPVAIFGLWVGLAVAYWLLGPWSSILTSAATSIFIALLVTMALWHEGVVRAYAVGILSVQVLHAAGGLSGTVLSPWLLMASDPFTTLSGSSGQLWQFGFVTTASSWTAALLAGACCGLYVWFLERSRKADDQAADARAEDI